ncbi:MAG: lecithin retinol acyltransferase family protein [Synechococcus sp.]
MAAADHLQVPRQHGLFCHHGIDLGDGTVAHYLEGQEILRSSLKDFSQNQPVSVVPHPECSPPGVTLRRAMSRIGEQNYNLLFNNCEHFATWCKTGRHHSAQVTGVVDKTRSWSARIPSALIAALELLVQRGLLDANSRAMARKGMQQLERLRLNLLNKLETLLQQNGRANHANRLLSGQNLADEIAAVEELQQKIDALLAQPHSQPETRQAE